MAPLLMPPAGKVPKKPPNMSCLLIPSLTYLNTTLLFIITLSIPALLLLHSPPSPTSSCNSTSSSPTGRGGGDHPSSYVEDDLRRVDFAWNRLAVLDPAVPPPTSLKIAVFSRKWPSTSSPGGMERHALTLHSALARRGHRVHVYTSALDSAAAAAALLTNSSNTRMTTYPVVHFLKRSSPNKWDYHEAWSMFQAENGSEPFDAVHSESVALPHSLARSLPNLAVSWHGVALEALHSRIYQEYLAINDQAPPPPPQPPTETAAVDVVQKIVAEIRFFHSYSHHVAISDSAGEMLRDVYQIPPDRVHVILNGVDDEAFGPDPRLGREFRARHGIPDNATVMGVSGRLVKDKGHPLLHRAFSHLRPGGTTSTPGPVYLLVAGTGPWEQRYRELGRRRGVITLGALAPDELGAFYNSLDVFLNPTLRPQGLDLTLMEAMMCGKPIAATGFPSIKGSVIVDPEMGHTFAPNVESLLEVLNRVVEEGPGRLGERGRACHKYASSMFTATKMALAYERLFLCIKNEEFCTRTPFSN
ncbi:hypothetical protein H6P81_012721 [Aristolochia fimbriata]|uniref:Glycosyltransferase subfamily 4-like N-terminal domain-containing protein n=1 Tax=Aristolochia fimbriata TaxID=158543 RepID=A0AAV7ECX2_ARIFI|nr:hypothetical protein H6P81_012721 [Aristolochia fimbriata]